MQHQSILIHSQEKIDSKGVLSLLQRENQIPVSSTIHPSNLYIIKKTEEERSLSIETARELVQWNSTKTSTLRIAMIFDAESLTTEAQNTLLKVIEEPSPHTLFICITQSRSAILPTIQSRCLLIETTNTDTQNVIKTKLLDYWHASPIEAKQKLVELFQAEKHPHHAARVISLIMKQVVEMREKLFKHNQVAFKDMIELLEDCSEASLSSPNPKLLATTIHLHLQPYIHA